MATIVDEPKSHAPRSAKKAARSQRGTNRPKDQPLTRVDRTRREWVNWYALAWLGGAHLVVLAAPWVFTWSGLALAVVLHWICGGIGICLGYHRFLTHAGFRTSNWLRYTIASIGTLAGEGSPLDWVADHRKHHALSDQPGDPHTPHEGGWWSHMFWLAYSTHGGDTEAYYKRWIPDLASDRGLRIIHHLFLPLNLGLGLVLAGVGYAVGGPELAASWVVWGMFVRLVAVLHSTWLVNSASHLWGYRNYETTDDSRNNWLVALVTYGEGWHNNHHAYPRMAKHGHRWWEFDITYQTIRLMRLVGLARDVVDYRNAAEKRKSA